MVHLAREGSESSRNQAGYIFIYIQMMGNQERGEDGKAEVKRERKGEWVSGRKRGRENEYWDKAIYGQNSPQSHTSSSKTPPPKGSIVFLNSTTKWRLTTPAYRDSYQTNLHTWYL